MTLTRDEIEGLLPFLVNGTLEGAERDEVQAAVDADGDLAAQFEALAAVRQTMQADETGFSPGEMGLARLMREVEADAQKPSLMQGAVVRPWVWQSVAAILLAVVLGQGVLLMSGQDNGPGFELAGGKEALFTIAVRPDATEGDLRAVLLTAGVEIVYGPSALGLYGIAVLEGTDPDDALVQLETAVAVIETVESAEGN